MRRVLWSLLGPGLLPGCVFLRMYREQIPWSEADVDHAGALRSETPDWRIAGQSEPADNRVTVVYEVGAQGVAEGGGLKLTLGHVLPTDQKLYTPFSLTAPSAYFFKINLLQDVEVTSSNPDVRLRVSEPRPARGLKEMLRYIKYKRSDEGQEHRDNLLRQIDNELALRIAVKRGELAPGDTVRVVLGARDGLPAPTREASLQIVARLDGDGDGVFGLVPDPPSFDVYSGDVAAVRLIGPSTLAPGEVSRMVLRVEDGYFLPNLARFSEARIELDPQPGLSFDTSPAVQADLETWSGSLTELALTAEEPGLYRITGTATIDGERFDIRSNPIEVAAEGRHAYFGDLHTHSILSYDADRPPAYVWWRQKVQERHDFAALSDHDMIGGVPFAPRTGIAGLTPDEWAYAQQLADEFDEPGVFAAIKAYEWTSYYYGHRNLYFAPDEDDPPLLHHNHPSEGEKPDENTPGELRDGLPTDLDYIAIPHSTAWPTGATHYHWGPGTSDKGLYYGDPTVWPQQRLIELYSTHGTSEYFDNPYAVDKGHKEAPTDSDLVRDLMSYNIQQAPADSGNFAQDALAAGWRFGFIGSSDMHYLSHIDQAYKYGFAAVWADSLDRQGIWDGLQRRETYATTGVRMILRCDADGEPMGSLVSLGGRTATTLTGQVHGTDALSRLEIVKYDGEAYSIAWEQDPNGALDVDFADIEIPVKPGDFLYLRVTQAGGDMGWATPIWFAD